MTVLPTANKKVIANFKNSGFTQSKSSILTKLFNYKAIGIIPYGKIKQ